MRPNFRAIPTEFGLALISSRFLSPPHNSSIIVLVGPSGSGKSTVGRAAALRLGWRFVDLDREIERRTETTVSEIFSTRGEAFFRGLESDVSVELFTKEEGGLIIASGGGWVTNSAAMELALVKSRIIYLKVTPQTALARLGAEQDSRPLLRGSDPLGSLVRLQMEREEYYTQAHSVINTEVLDLQRVINEVVILAAVYWAE